MGYSWCGLRPIGIDIDDKMLARYPFESFNMNWQEALERFGPTADLIHASPPCQLYSCAVLNTNKGNFPDLVGPVREALIKAGKPYVIENVPQSPIKTTVKLCGCMFNLGVEYQGTRFQVYRPRLFELSWETTQPEHRGHNAPALPVMGQGVPGWFYRKHGHGMPERLRGAAMGTPWMTAIGTSESIPPAFTQFICSARDDPALL